MITYHIVPTELWDAQLDAPTYAAASLAEEGFIHTTDGVANMVATANRHYHADPRPFYVLTLDLDRLTSHWQYDDAGRIYPHIYGPINRDAVLKVAPMPRASDGTFVAWKEEEVS